MSDNFLYLDRLIGCGSFAMILGI